MSTPADAGSRPAAATRVTVTVPAGFDPPRHGAKLLERIEATHGDGFRIQSHDPVTREVIAVRESAVAEFADDGEAIHVSLPDGTRESHGPKIAAEYEALKPGWKVTQFRPYGKPGFATMRQLSEAEVRVRDAVAQALRVSKTPWSVQVTAREDRGYDLGLPDHYSPAAHDEKLAEVAETAAGEPGWYVTVDAKTLVGAIHPGELPTFPPMIDYPFDREIPAFTAPADTRWAKIPLGRALGRPGEKTGPELCLDLKASAHTLLQGLPMSGKSLTINAVAYWMLSAGAELAIVDTPDKAVDFEWLKPYVRDGGWGGESYAAMVATCALVYAEGKRRARVLKARGLTNWFDITDDDSFRPLVLIADEYTGLTTQERVPKSLPREHPLRVEAEDTNGYKDMVATFVQKIALEMRFVGVHVLVSTQLGNTKTGVSTALKAACGNRFLMGPNASDNQRSNAFAAPDTVATVPANVATAEGVSKGVGVSETEGQPSTVFKGYHATVAEFAAHLGANAALRRTSRPEPTRAEIAEHTGLDDLDDTADAASAPPAGSGNRFVSAGMQIARAEGLEGAAAASYAARLDSQQAQQERTGPDDRTER